MASIWLANPSELTPLTVYVSLAITVVNTPGALSLSSNHPTCLQIIEEYSCYLNLSVTFSAIMPKENFYKKPVKKLTKEHISIYKVSIFD